MKTGKMTLKENIVVLGLAASFGYDRDKDPVTLLKAEEAQRRGRYFRKTAHVRKNCPKTCHFEFQNQFGRNSEDSR